MQIPPNLQPGQFTLKDLAEWYAGVRPIGDIEMTLAQEMWYRHLLPPQFMTPQYVTFRGHRIVEHGTS